jgi:hypothetical protein
MSNITLEIARSDETPNNYLGMPVNTWTIRTRDPPDSIPPSVIATSLYPSFGANVSLGINFISFYLTEPVVAAKGSIILGKQSGNTATTIYTIVPNTTDSWLTLTDVTANNVKDMTAVGLFKPSVGMVKAVLTFPQTLIQIYEATYFVAISTGAFQV